MTLLRDLKKGEAVLPQLETVVVFCSNCPETLEGEALLGTGFTQYALMRDWDFSRSGRLICPKCVALEKQEDLLDEFGEDLLG